MRRTARVIMIWFVVAVLMSTASRGDLPEGCREPIQACIEAEAPSVVKSACLEPGVGGVEDCCSSEQQWMVGVQCIEDFDEDEEEESGEEVSVDEETCSAKDRDQWREEFERWRTACAAGGEEPMATGVVSDDEDVVENTAVGGPVSRFAVGSFIFVVVALVALCCWVRIKKSRPVDPVVPHPDFEY